MPCTSLPQYSSTTMNLACTTITRSGSSKSPRTNPSRNTVIIKPAKTMPTPISNAKLMGREVVVAITAGKLDFGPWEQIFYGEFDGRRRKRVLVKIIGE